MKKRVLILIALFVLLFGALKTSNFNLYIQSSNDLNVKKVCLIISENDFVDNANYKNFLNCGGMVFAYKNSLDLDDFSKKEIDYVEVYFANGNLNYLLKLFCAKVLLKECVYDKTIYYCHTNLLEKFIFLKSFKINLQFVIMQDEIKMGYPMIYSSF